MRRIEQEAAKTVFSFGCDSRFGVPAGPGGENSQAKGRPPMSNLHKQAMEAVLQAAAHDIVATLQERGVEDKHSEDGDLVIMDVAILHAYRIFMRICEENGLEADAGYFADLANDLAEEVEQDVD
jgi:hypothetical protein